MRDRGAGVEGLLWNLIPFNIFVNLNFGRHASRKKVIQQPLLPSLIIQTRDDI